MQKIKKIVASMLLVTIIFLMIPFESFASPSGNPGSHSVSDDDVLSPDADDMEELYDCMDAADSAWNEYMFSLAQDANTLATWTLQNPDVVAASILYDWLPSGALEALPKAAEDWINQKKLSYSDIENMDSTSQDDYAQWLNDSFIFTVDSNTGEIVAQIKDSAKDISQTINDAVIEINRNNMILYQTQSIDDIDKFLKWEDYRDNDNYYPMSKQGVINIITSKFTDNDYPLYFSRSTSSFGVVSLSNIQNEYNCDGFVCRTNWSAFLERFNAFQSNGYLNNLNGQEITSSFYVYADGRKFEDINVFKKRDDNSLTQPFIAYAYSYSEYRPDMIRQQSCIISLDGSPMIFFKDSASYLDFYSNKMLIPYDFNGQNVNYSDMLNNLDKSALASATSLNEIYSLLNDSIAQSIQDAVDRLTTNNEWLKKIYKDLHDFKKEWNLRNFFSTLTDIVGAVDDLLSINRELMRLVNNQIDSEVIDDIEGIIHNTSLLAHIKSKFPFCIPIALVGTVDYISSFEPMPLKFSISSNALGVPLCFNFDYESIPGHTTVTVIVKSFIFLIFAFGMFKLTLNIMGKIGGGS